MADLIFRYGSMNSGKTLNILQTLHNYERHNLKTTLIKSIRDTKGDNKIVSRIGIEKEVDILLGEESLLQKKYYQKYYTSRVILVDEVELLTEDQIEELWTIAHLINIPVITFGLKSNFKGDIFSPSVGKLFALADIIDEIGSTSLCTCGKIAIFNSRKVNKKWTDVGEVVLIEGSDEKVEYVPLCGDCYLKYVKIRSEQVKKLTELVEEVK